MADENLTADERAAIIKLLRATIAIDPYPLSPRIRRLKSALAKLDPASAPEPEKPAAQVPPAQPWKPSMLAAKKRRARR